MTARTSAKFSSIKKPNVVGVIVDSLKQALVQGALKPGERLPSEAELAEQMGVGRSAVREALKVMEALGAIVIRPGAGNFVAEGPSAAMLGPLIQALVLESETSLELFELRFAIQLGYCTIASRNATDEDWKAIRAAAADLEAHADDTRIDVETLIVLDQAFHTAILKATHNPLIERIGQTVEELFFASFRNNMVMAVQPGAAIRDHREILAALETGDGATLYRITERILTGWRKGMAKTNIPPLSETA